ncbi:MAG: hypothetical protein WD651_09405 [Acidimicrobiia bacterium]
MSGQIAHGNRRAEQVTGLLVAVDRQSRDELVLLSTIDERDEAADPASRVRQLKLVTGPRQAGEMAKRAFAVRPVLTAWVLTVGIDLFFNAGVFMPLFDQERESSLLPDELLFRRIPVAYLSLLVGAAALGWLIDKIDISEVRQGVIVGGISGVVLSLMGLVSLWTAIDMTGIFVMAGSLVVIAEFASAGGVLQAFRLGPHPARLARRILLAALLAGIAGIAIQNLQA